MVGFVAVLSGCGGEQLPQPTTTPSSASSSQSPSERPSTDETTSPSADTDTISFSDALGREFTVASPTRAEVDAENAQVTMRATLAAPEDALLLTAPGSARWEVQSDSSALLRDDDTEAPDGAPIFGGTPAPRARDANDSSVRVEVSASSDNAENVPGDGDSEQTLEFTLQPRGITEFPVELEVSLAPQALERLEWAGDLEGRRSLQVFPTAWGRSGSEAASSAVWQSIIALEPEADTDVMNKQLRCHALGAPDKTSWNLEPWRPDVSYLDYLIARCNPS